jgi:hypothetical protein
MADTFDRATHNTQLVGEMKAYAKDFYDKFRKSLDESGPGHSHNH